MNRTVSMKIVGDLACFTRPEFKSERVSYPIITPSAARGCLEAVMWKPSMRWQVEQIAVLKPIKYVGFKRNEVTDKMSLGSELFADDKRAQRNTVALRDVSYVISAKVILTRRASNEENETKFIEMFERRLSRGQTFAQPYLGCREFVGYVSKAETNYSAISESRDLGFVLYDIERDGSGRAIRPIFFQARMDNGVINVPDLSTSGEFEC